jgi:hypothetical protein
MTIILQAPEPPPVATAPYTAISGVLVDDVVAQVAVVLQDVAKVRWTATQHIVNLNAALRECIDLRPDAFLQVRSLQLSKGTEQVLGEGGVYLSRIVCNLGADGATLGAAPRPVDEMDMDLTRPGWRGDPMSGIVRNYIIDPRTPRRFQVWPPQPILGPHYVRVLQGEYPAAVALGEEMLFPLSDNFINAVIHLSLYFGWQKAVGGDLGRSAYHRKEALQMLGVSGQTQQATR